MSIGLVLLFMTGIALLIKENQSTIQTEILIEKSRSEVFEFVTTPAYWPLWHPSSLEVTGTKDHSLNVDEQVTEAFLVAGRKGAVVWTVIEKERPDLWAIEGEIEGGKGAGGTITYRLTGEGNDTRFQRTFDYHMPGLFYPVMNRLFFKKRIRQESQKALEVLKKVIEEG